MTAPLTLLWHRTDVRLADNAALAAASRAASGAVVGAVVLPTEPHEPASLSRAPQSSDASRQPSASRGAARAARLNVVPDVARSSPRRLGHLLQAIEELRADWERAGSALFVLHGDAAASVPALAAELGVREVHTAPCPASDERRENAAVARGLTACGGTLHVHDETTMIAAADLPFEIDELPDVFSSFRRLVERQCAVREPLPQPALVGVPEVVRQLAHERSSRALAEDVFTQAHAAAKAQDPRATFTCHGGRSHGLARMQRWFWQNDCIARYKETRDGLVGSDFSSRLSPWLATGAISPREVAAEIRRYERERTANESTYWLFFELLWRDYFHFWVRRWQGRAFKARGVLGRTPCGAQDLATFRDWCAGTTGEPFVDASMRELQATGQLSNRARQNVASWLAKTAGIDWRWGAAWFESQLIDFDVGPNWGNWQYVAGVGNDPRNRTFDVRAQAERYDGDGAYRRTWGASPTQASPR